MRRRHSGGKSRRATLVAQHRRPVFVFQTTRIAQVNTTMPIDFWRFHFLHVDVGTSRACSNISEEIPYVIRKLKFGGDGQVELIQEWRQEGRRTFARGILPDHARGTEPAAIAFINALHGRVEAPEVESSSTAVTVNEASPRPTRRAKIVVVHLIGTGFRRIRRASFRLLFGANWRCSSVLCLAFVSLCELHGRGLNGRVVEVEGRTGTRHGQIVIHATRTRRFCLHGGWMGS